MAPVQNHSNHLKYQYNSSGNDRMIPPAPAGRVIASLVLGIASILLCVVPFMLIAAVIGVTLERESEREGWHKLQKPALILCIIGIILCSLAIAALLVGIFVLGILSR